MLFAYKKWYGNNITHRKLGSDVDWRRMALEKEGIYEERWAIDGVPESTCERIFGYDYLESYETLVERCALYILNLSQLVQEGTGA